MILSHELRTHALDRYTLSAVQVLVSLDRLTPEDVEAAVTFVQQQQVCDCLVLPHLLLWSNRMSLCLDLRQ